MDNKTNDKLLIMQATIDANRKEYDDKTNKQKSKLDKLTELVKSMMDQIKIYNSSIDKMD